MGKFWRTIKHAQVTCTRCGEPSPVVPYRQFSDKTNKQVIADQIIAALLELGWETAGEKCYCPICRRLGG